MRPRALISHTIQIILRSIGVRKLDHQFLLSYVLIFLCALGLRIPANVNTHTG